MSILFEDARATTRETGRWTTGLWLSVFSHAIVVVVLIVAPIRASEKPATPPMQSRLVFVLPASQPLTLPLAPPVTRVPPAPTPPRPVHEVVKAEAPKPLPATPIVTKPIEPALAPPAAVAVIDRPVEAPVVQRAPETGLFERTNAARTSQTAAAVTTGAFGSAAVAPRDAANGAVTTGGFGNAAPAPRAIAQGEVHKSGFDRASAPAQTAAAAVTRPNDRPVEIVSKPTPEYSEEARSARIEGTVSLELDFTAAGDVRVVRVVRGLGHGLDEAAQRAALRIRFKPAQSDGRAVDSRATVHITFRLS